MADEYQNYLRKIANRHKTSDELIETWVKEASGTKLKSKTKIMTGEANEVYEVNTHDRQTLIVRINHSTKPTFYQEKWAIEQCFQKGIPVPKVLLVKHIQKNNQILSVCIQERLPGDTMERGRINYWNMPDTQVKTLLFKSGQLLARIHSIKIAGFGELSGQGQGKYTTFSQMVLEKPKGEKAYHVLVKKLNLSLSQMQKALKILTLAGEKFSNTNSVLNHGDFAAKHIMYERDKLTGLIDFGEVLGHSPVYDFARWEYWFGNDKYYGWIKDGYTDKLIFGDGFDELSRVIQVDICLGTMYWYFQQKYSRGIKMAVTKLTKLI